MNILVTNENIKCKERGDERDRVSGVTKQK